MKKELEIVEMLGKLKQEREERSSGKIWSRNEAKISTLEWVLELCSDSEMHLE